VRILETALSSHSRPSFCNAGHSPTGAAYWILSGASQASRAADEVIEYGHSDIWHISDVDLSTNDGFAPEGAIREWAKFCSIGAAAYSQNTRRLSALA